MICKKKILFIRNIECFKQWTHSAKSKSPPPPILTAKQKKQTSLLDNGGQNFLPKLVGVRLMGSTQSYKLLQRFVKITWLSLYITIQTSINLYTVTGLNQRFKIHSLESNLTLDGFPNPTCLPGSGVKLMSCSFYTYKVYLL